MAKATQGMSDRHIRLQQRNRDWKHLHPLKSGGQSVHELKAVLVGHASGSGTKKPSQTCSFTLAFNLRSKGTPAFRIDDRVTRFAVSIGSHSDLGARTCQRL